MIAMLRATVLALAVLGGGASEAKGTESPPTASASLLEGKNQALEQAAEVVTEASLDLRSHLPPWFRHRWLWGLERWQWLGVPLMLLLSLALAALLSRLSTRLLARLAERSETPTDDEVATRLAGPLRLLWFGLLGSLSLQFLSLPETGEAWGSRLFRVLLGLGFFWAVARAVDTWTTRYVVSEHAAARPGSKALANLVGRITQFAVVAFAALATLSELGFSVTSVLAGLGIGGIALALGAQKTLENLFGAFALAVDQPIREGDFVKIDDFTGTVEAIGLRSTRIRTLDRTIVTVPNGKLADMRLETFAARDRFRLHTTLGLTYGTTAGQLRQVRDGLERVLRAHPKIWPDTVSVRFGAFADFSLNVEVMCWFLVKDFEEFKLVREEVLLQFMEVVEEAGSGFAFPTRTVHLVQATAKPTA
jgi:MscS family membrane protein